MSRFWPCVAVFLLLNGLVPPAFAEAQGGQLPAVPPGQKWVFAMGNLATREGMEALVALAKRSGKAGYNGFMLMDIKFDKFQLQGKEYLDNLQAFRQVCREANLKFIPCVTPFGYSDVFLTNDPNLAEGMPVRDAAFVVKDGKLVPFDETTRFVNGSFEEWKDDTPIGWSVDGPGQMSFRDEQVKSDGKASLRQEDVAKHEPKSLHARVWQKIPVKPWHYYHLSVMVEPGGFVNVIRRDSLPLKVTSPDGKTVYEEGKDFSKVADPRLDHDPNPGYFTNWHPAPEVTVPAGSRLKEGDTVLAGYHFASTCGKPNNINMCMSEPKTYEIVEQQIRWVKENAQPDIYQLAHDEIRLSGWDDSCARTGKTNGQILADNVRRCVEIIRKVDPGKPIMVWNDMFDPFHNARDKADDGMPFVMYMAKGNWFGSWEGLTPDVAVGDWLQQSVPSVEFFSKRGHPVLLMGYYDADPKRIAEWLQSTAHCKNMIGVMYTTWMNDYTKLEEFMDLVKAHEARPPEK